MPTINANPIVLGADSVRAELAEASEAHGLTPAQTRRIQALPSAQIDEAIRAAADDDFWDAYDSVRRDAIASLAAYPLVLIVFMDGEDYENAVDAANDLGGSTEAVVEYLSQWDFGEEDDNAASITGYTDLADLEANRHQLHEVDHGGLHYWLQLDHALGIYALYRRPL